MSEIARYWEHAASWLTDGALIPTLALMGFQPLRADVHEIALSLMIAAIQVAVIALVFRPLEDVVPAERWSDRKLTGVDRFATLLMVFGLLPLFSFLVLLPVGQVLGGTLAGDAAPHGLKAWLPWLDGQPLVAMAIYYVVYDLAYYWLHRAQHAIPWWWALHSMHHSQRQMSCWSNDRGSYIDAVFQGLIFGALGIALGMEASEFALVSLVSELMQCFSHANVAIGFGSVGERLFVDPRFHRLHHMRVDLQRPGLHNCNFGQVLPWWDMLFGTALYGEPVRPTGVADPIVDADNTRSYMVMQWWTAKRFWGAVTRASGWVPQEVAFGPGLAPIPVSHDASHDNHGAEQTHGQRTTAQQ